MKNVLNIILLTIVLNSCISTNKKSNQSIKLLGKGSSFSLPYSSLFFREYSKNPNIQIDFDAQNSYDGINAIQNGTVDFAVTEVFLPEKQSEILHIPLAVAGINFAYNLTNEGFSLRDDPVYMTPDIIAKILTGKITKWNDPEITQLNKEISIDKDRVFPNLKITSMYREDPSGDTFVLTKFLTKSSTFWKNGITNQISIKNGVAGSNALDIIRSVLSTPGSFGYTTMIYGVQNNIPVVRVKNYLGTYVRGCNFRSLEAMKVAETNSDNRVDLTYPKNSKESAVAASFIYMLVRQEQNYNNRTKEQAQALVDLLYWLLTPEVQKQLENILFANLTPKFRYAAQQTLKTITYDGVPLKPTPIKNKKK